MKLLRSVLILLALVCAAPAWAQIDATNNAFAVEIANAASTGTTVNMVAKLTGAPSTAVITTTSDTSGAIGVVVGGAGTSGNAVIATGGTASCSFDGATTAGHYVQMSVTTGGKCHDAGSGFPTSGQVLGVVLSTNGGAGTYAMTVFPPGVIGNNGGGASLSAAQSWTAGQAVTPTAGGTQSAGGTMTVDFAASNSKTFTFGAGNLSISNPSNVKAGQTFIFVATQDGTGSRTIAWDTQYKWPGGTAPTLSTAGGAKDVISCFADTTTTINCTLAVKGAA